MPVAGSPFFSTLEYPVNEDYTMVMLVKSVEAGVVIATKVFDEATLKTEFLATMQFNGYEGIPPDTSLDVDDYCIFHRTGESEFICFVAPRIVQVTDNGGGSGTANGITKALQYSDPAGNYHSTAAIWNAGSIYFALDLGDTYLAYVPGFGPSAKTFTATAGEVTWNIEVDASGKVLEFTAEEA